MVTFRPLNGNAAGTALFRRRGTECHGMRSARSKPASTWEAGSLKGKNSPNRVASGRSDQQLEAMLDEPAGWVVKAARGVVLGRANNLREALDGIVDTGARQRVVSLEKEPVGEVVVFWAQLERLTEPMRPGPRPARFPTTSPARAGWPSQETLPAPLNSGCTVKGNDHESSLVIGSLCFPRGASLGAVCR